MSCAALKRVERFLDHHQVPRAIGITTLRRFVALVRMLDDADPRVAQRGHDALRELADTSRDALAHLDPHAPVAR